MAERGVHLIDPLAFAHRRVERPWCGHGRYVPCVEYPDEGVTCQHCLRKWERAERAERPGTCSMCAERPATTTWGFPVCEPCSDWLDCIDADLRAQFPEPHERYIDRARRAIRQRRTLESVRASDDDRPVAS